MSVIDRFVVELALDPKKFSGPAKKAVEDLRTFEKQAGKTGNSIEGVGRKGADAFAGVRREALAMFAVFTAGRSLKAFVSDTTKANTQLDYMSQRLNMDPGGLTRLETAAKAAGGTFGEVTQSFAALQQRLTDPQQWAQVTRAFTQLGVTDFTDEHGRIRADIVSRLNKGIHANHVDNAVATGYLKDLGFGDGVINQALMDPAKLKELQAEAAKIPALSRQQLENSRELYQSLTILRQESEQFTNSLVANLSPELTQVIRQFMDWEHEHPKIAAGVGGITLAVNELTQAFGGLGGILASIAGYRILKALGGGAGAVMGASGGVSAAGSVASAAGIAALPAIAGGVGIYYGIQGEKATEAEIAQSRKDADKNKDERRRYLYKSLIDAKFSRNAALGVIGNIDQESQLNPLARGDAGLFGPQAFGIGQWHKQRVRDIKSKFGIDVRSASYKDQVRALILEMQSGEDAGAKKAGTLLNNPNISVEDATQAVRKYFERPRDAKGQEDAWRTALAVKARDAIPENVDNIQIDANSPAISQAAKTFDKTYDSASKAEQEAAVKRLKDVQAALREQMTQAAKSIGTDPSAQLAARAVPGGGGSGNTTNNATNFHGDIVINTQATDGKGVVDAFNDHFGHFNRRSILAVNSPGLQ